MRRIDAIRRGRFARTVVALAIRLATVASPHAASADSVDVARVEQQLQEAQYARIGIDGRNHVLIKPQVEREGLRYERMEKLLRRRYEIVETGRDSVVPPLANPVPWSRIDQIDSGTRPRLPSALVGGTIGLATGIAVGAGLSLFGIHMSGGGWDEEASGFTLATGGIFGVVGAGIGALLPATRWKQVYPGPKQSEQR